MSIRINVLTYNGCPNSRAFNCPLLAAKPIFTRHGMNLKFFYNANDQVFESDVLFLNSRFFKSFWQKDKQQIFDFIEAAKRHQQKVIWFDTTDSTWCTQFEVLPYVDHYLKSQLLKDHAQYLHNYRTGRIYTDVFDSLYDCGESEVTYPGPDSEHMHKLDVSWNTCFENYLESRYGLFRKVMQALRPITSNIWNGTIKIDFTSPEYGRHIPVSNRVGLSHSRPSVIAHRQAINNILEKRGINCDKVPLDNYFNELRHSQIGVGPFGVGEITLRDFEIIICGAALLKPTMDHLETWPDLFQPNKSYIPFKWDLSDFDEVLDNMIANKELCREIAGNAQVIYKSATSDDGLEVLVLRLLEKINS